LIVGQCINGREEIAKVYDPENIGNCVEFLPLR
jgi:hypothetical protein